MIVGLNIFSKFPNIRISRISTCFIHSSSGLGTFVVFVNSRVQFLTAPAKRAKHLFSRQVPNNFWWISAAISNVLLSNKPLSLSCYNHLQKCCDTSTKNDLSCFQSLLVTGLWDIIRASLLPPIQSCSSRFWVWSCFASNDFDKRCICQQKAQ